MIAVWGDLEGMANASFILFSHWLNTTKAYSLMLHHQEIEDMLMDVDCTILLIQIQFWGIFHIIFFLYITAYQFNPFGSNHIKKLHTEKQHIQNVFKIFTLSCFCTLFLMFGVPFLSLKTMNINEIGFENNFTIIAQRKLPLDVWVPFDFTNSPLYVKKRLAT